MRVGFIGTGNIGNPMAANVIAAGHELVVNDLDQERTENLVELGATWVSTPAEATAASEVVLTSLPGPPEVEAVLTGSDGILAGAQSGTVYFDLSTNSPADARRLAAIAAERGVTMLDAPVSNGVQGARDAKLAVMVGGDEATFDRYRSVLEAIGEHIFYMGESGMGALTKLVNNMIAITSGMVLQEAVVLSAKAGLPPERGHEVWSVASAQRLVGGIPRLLERQVDDPSFALNLAAKDLRLAIETGNQAGVAMPLASAAADNLLRAAGRGWGDKAIVAALVDAEQNAGLRDDASD